jgi:hypothetical protein
MSKVGEEGEGGGGGEGEGAKAGGKAIPASFAELSALAKSRRGAVSVAAGGELPDSDACPSFRTRDPTTNIHTCK